MTGTRRLFTAVLYLQILDKSICEPLSSDRFGDCTWYLDLGRSQRRIFYLTNAICVECPRRDDADSGAANTVYIEAFLVSFIETHIFLELLQCLTGVWTCKICSSVLVKELQLGTARKRRSDQVRLGAPQ